MRSLSTSAVANFARSEMATALRKAPYYANVLIAGYDEGVGPSLYWMDYLATMHRYDGGHVHQDVVQTAVHVVGLFSITTHVQYEQYPPLHTV